MCGRATLKASPDALRETFDLVGEIPTMVPRFNIAPSQLLPVIREPGRLELLPWGNAQRRVVNVRVESASAVPANRCLVVVDGFYEWRAGDRQPFYFHRHDDKPFALAGAVLGGGAVAAIVTCPPQGLVGEIHNRMPLVLTQQDWSRWLAGEKPAASLDGVERFAVARIVNNAGVDDPRCIEPVAEPAAP